MFWGCGDLFPLVLGLWEGGRVCRRVVLKRVQLCSAECCAHGKGVKHIWDFFGCLHVAFFFPLFFFFPSFLVFFHMSKQGQVITPR